ncbi:acetyltransferase [Minicystis rosea]|nr:acetyltransferase [Minicystis rosea]
MPSRTCGVGSIARREDDGGDLMRSIPAEVLAIAETLNLCLPPPPNQDRVVEPRFAAFIGVQDEPQHNIVQRLRVAPSEVDATVAEVRALFRARGRTALTWEIGPSSAPADLCERLLALGMVPDDEPEMAGMILTRAPEKAPNGVVVERVRTFEQFRVLKLVYHRCFGRGAKAPTEAEIAADFERRKGKEDHLIRYLALANGAPIAAADAVFIDGAVVLCGGATLPEARGQGAYRALVQARWEDAIARRTPVLVVQAGAMSRPILARMGFEEVVRVRVLLDRLR